MLQALGAGIGAAIMAYIFSKLDPRQRLIAGGICAVAAVVVIVWAVLIIGQ